MDIGVLAQAAGATETDTVRIVNTVSNLIQTCFLAYLSYRFGGAVAERKRRNNGDE